MQKNGSQVVLFTLTKGNRLPYFLKYRPVASDSRQPLWGLFENFESDIIKSFIKGNLNKRINDISVFIYRGSDNHCYLVRIDQLKLGGKVDML